MADGTGYRMSIATENDSKITLRHFTIVYQRTIQPRVVVC